MKFLNKVLFTGALGAVVSASILGTQDGVLSPGQMGLHDAVVNGDLALVQTFFKTEKLIEMHKMLMVVLFCTLLPLTDRPALLIFFLKGDLILMPKPIKVRLRYVSQ